jgi:hypothetical protein
MCLSKHFATETWKEWRYISIHSETLALDGDEWSASNPGRFSPGEWAPYNVGWGHGLNTVCFWRDSPRWDRASSFTRFIDHTQRRTTLGRTPLHEWSARRRDLYLTTHNTHNRQTYMPRWDSNPQSQQASGRRPTPKTGGLNTEDNKKYLSWLVIEPRSFSPPLKLRLALAIRVSGLPS